MDLPIDIQRQLIDLLGNPEPDYRSILKLSNELAKTDKKFQRFSIDAKTLIHLGRDSIKDHTTALIELVKNSYDADAQNVEVDVLCRNGNDLIRVSDNGFGMNRNQLLNSWLRIGYSEKRVSKLSEHGRRKTGEKGIGRISTDRLGAKLELITKTKEDGLIGLRINWDEFDVEGKEFFDIEIELTEPASINIPAHDGAVSESGTEIRITRLRQVWSLRNVESLYYELSALTPPFQSIADFDVVLKNDISAAFSKKVDSDFYRSSEIELTLVYDGSGSEILYSIKDKYNSDEHTDKIAWQNLLNDLPKRDVDPIVTEDLSLGPITITLLFFLRDSSSVANANFNLSALRSFLDNNAGVKIYRDNFAVRPYGFPSSQFGADWLELGERKIRNPAGIGRAQDYSVNPNQLVGAVFISRDKNPKLVDSAAREGLVESPEFAELKALVMGSVLLLESHRAKIYPQISGARNNKKEKNSQEDAEKIKTQLSEVSNDLNEIKITIENDEKNIKPQTFLKPLVKSIATVANVFKEVDTTIADLLNWQRTLSGLATMGISSAVFGHETESSITQVKSSVSIAIDELQQEPPNLKSALEELEKALRNSKRVAAWGAYALTRVQREKRSRRMTNIKKIISTVVAELKPAFEASSIKVETKGDNFFANTYPMDIESILVNLLTNAYTATLLKGGERIVSIYVEKHVHDNKDGFHFWVSDTGPGIAKEFEHRIFEPLFSTKTIGANKSKSVGTGLGLTIVKSITDELGGIVSFDRDPVLKGARFTIWMPLLK